MTDSYEDAHTLHVFLFMMDGKSSYKNVSATESACEIYFIRLWAIHSVVNGLRR